MTPWQRRADALTQRMAEDMLLRNLSQKTIDAYTYHVRRFARFLKRSPESASPEDVRSFQLHLIRDVRVGLEFVQSGSVWPTFPVSPHVSPRVACGHGSLREEAEDAAGGAQRGRSQSPALMHQQHQASHVSADLLCSRAAAQRNGRSANCRHRQSADAAHRRPRQGSEGTSSPTLAATVNGTPRVLENDSAAGSVVSRSRSVTTDQRQFHAEGLQSGRAQVGFEEERHAAHAQAFLRDRTAGSRPADDLPTAGPQKFQHDAGLSARAADASAQRSESPSTGFRCDSFPAGNSLGRADRNEKDSDHNASRDSE